MSITSNFPEIKVSNGKNETSAEPGIFSIEIANKEGTILIN
jgi:hypothetical protein